MKLGKPLCWNLPPPVHGFLYKSRSVWWRVTAPTLTQTVPEGSLPSDRNPSEAATPRNCRLVHEIFCNLSPVWHQHVKARLGSARWRDREWWVRLWITKPLIWGDTSLIGTNGGAGPPAAVSWPPFAEALIGAAGLGRRCLRLCFSEGARRKG